MNALEFVVSKIKEKEQMDGVNCFNCDHYKIAGSFCKSHKEKTKSDDRCGRYKDKFPVYTEDKKGQSIDKYREQHPEKPSRGTIYNWINKGYLEYYRLPSGRIRITGEKTNE